MQAHQVYQCAQTHVRSAFRAWPGLASQIDDLNAIAGKAAEVARKSNLRHGYTAMTARHML
jgi:hypothetical protein